QGHAEPEIATILNDAGCTTDLGRAWTRGTVHQVLTNEKYIGHNVYNRTSFKLKAQRVVNPPERWIRAQNAFEPIVDSATFQAVRQVIEARSRRYSDSELLEALGALLRSHGTLSGLLIDEHDTMPSSHTYRTRFGSLVRAYQLVGYTPSRDYEYVAINKALRQLHPDVVSRTIAAIQDLGGGVRRDTASDLLVLNDEITVSIVICRCYTQTNGSRRWRIRLDAGLRPNITVAVRMNAGNDSELDYYILPAIDLNTDTLRLSDDNGFWLDAYRTESLAAFFQLAARIPLSEVA
ncbi:MAG: recombinase family protein, partial [Vicinamibacterales bacterium]